MELTPIPERLALLDTITLDKGAHDSYEDGHCALEVVSFLAGLDITDTPECASPVIRVFTIQLNDEMSTGQRQKLKPFLPRMIGTAGDGHDETRSYMALDWLIRTYTPTWLDLAGLNTGAQALRNLHRITNMGSAVNAAPVVKEARQEAADALNTASDTTNDTAWGAAWVAARAAARHAARDAAWEAAQAAAGSATWAAAGDDARDASRDAARYTAAAAAQADTQADTQHTAWDALQPTVETLQSSALDLLGRMTLAGTEVTR